MNDLIQQSELIASELSPYGPSLHAGIVDIDASFFFMLALYLLFFFIMNRVLLVPLRNVFDERHALTEGAREAADNAVKRSEATIAEYEKRVGAARREALVKAKELKAQGQATEREMLDSVRGEVEAEVQKAFTGLQAERTRAEADLESTANETGQRIAAQILGGAA